MVFNVKENEGVSLDYGFKKFSSDSCSILFKFLDTFFLDVFTKGLFKVWVFSKLMNFLCFSLF